MEKATAQLLLPSIRSPFPLFSEPKSNPLDERNPEDWTWCHRNRIESETGHN